MEDFEQNQEVMRNDLDQLKEQVSKLVEVMQALERKRDAEGNSPVTNQEPQATPTHPPGFSPVPPQYFLNSQGMLVPIPPFGLPPGYTPLLAPNPSNGNSPASASNPPNLTESQNLHPGTNEISLTQLPSSSIGPHAIPPDYTPQPNTIPLENIPIAAPTSSPHNAPQTLYFNILGNPQSPPTSTKDAQSSEKLQILEERIRAIEGNESYSLDAFGMCLVPDVVIPRKFKVPEFDKYNGFTCPRNHLTMYCRKMAARAHDDKLLIHFFQDSLTGASLSWYMHLERNQIHSWKDLADAFLKRYKYNVDMAPDRMQLQNMVKKDEETFKEYAQRWREIAAQVEPPLSEKEMVAIFVDTLQSPFYDMMIGNVSFNFSDITTIEERVESGIRSGKIVYSSNRTINAKKPEAELLNKKGETHVVSSDQGGYSQKRLNHIPDNLNLNPNQRKSTKQKKKSVQFDSIPMSYTELLPYLIHQSLIVPSPMKLIEPPYPREYDPNAKCDYHAGAIGHSTENCRTLKHKVQDMINAGWLSFDGNNPLPRHEAPATDAVEGSLSVVSDGAFET